MTWTTEVPGCRNEYTLFESSCEKFVRERVTLSVVLTPVKAKLKLVPERWWLQHGKLALVHCQGE